MCTIWVPVGTPARICATSGQQGPKRKLDHTPNPPGQRHLQKGAWFSQAFRCTRLVLATRACLHFAHPRHSLGRPSRQSQPIGAEDSTRWAGFQVDWQGRERGNWKGSDFTQAASGGGLLRWLHTPSTHTRARLVRDYLKSARVRAFIYFTGPTSCPGPLTGSSSSS